MVQSLGLEQYLAGVVPQEMPSAWPDEALKAQAVAARSYALAHRLSGKVFDLYADVRSQVYGGIAGESVRTTAAIQATKGQVLLQEGKPIDALFHSTSGGATRLPRRSSASRSRYLVGVYDLHSVLLPCICWGPVAVAETTLRKGLGLAVPVKSLQLHPRTFGPGLDGPGDDPRRGRRRSPARRSVSRAGRVRPGSPSS